VPTSVIKRLLALTVADVSSSSSALATQTICIFRLLPGRRVAGLRPTVTFVAAMVITCGLVELVRAQGVRTYGFRPLGDVLDFSPTQVAYTAGGELQLYGILPASNGRQTLARWTEATGAIALVENPTGEFFVSDVSDGGTVVVGKSAGSGFDTQGDDAFRWTETGGLEVISPAGSLDNGVGSFIYGVSPDGSTLAGSRSQAGATLWRNSTNPTATLPVPNVTTFGGEPGRRASATDVVLDQFGNTWASGGYGVVWRNEDIVYQEPFDLSFNSSAGLAATENGIRVILNGSRSFPVAGIASVNFLIDFPDADPSQIEFTSLPFRSTNITRDGNAVLGFEPNGFSPRFQELMIWEDTPDLWGVVGGESVRDLLLDNLSATEVQAIGLEDWSFRVGERPINQSRDIANFRDGGIAQSAILSQGFNPNGELESFLVTVSVVPEPSTIALAWAGGVCLAGYTLRRRRPSATKSCV